MTSGDPIRRFHLTDHALLLTLGLIAFSAQILASNRFGYSRDEFYQFACGEHLDWGHVDQPPLVALVAFLVRRTRASRCSRYDSFPPCVTRW